MEVVGVGLAEVDGRVWCFGKEGDLAGVANMAGVGWAYFVLEVDEILPAVFVIVFDFDRGV